MKNFVLPIPADFPGQLFIRKAIVEALKHENELSIPKEIIHLLPFLGPLHVSLNTRESIFLTFHPFFNHLYKIIFGKKKNLAAKPKPWRINLLLYLAHAGWLIVKKYIITKFNISKDTSYITFLDLLDNLIPSALDVYAYLFRENHLEEYVSTVFRLWTAMRRFQRHNYDKIMLAFLSDFHYWKYIQHPIIDTLKTHLNIFDEYAVENFHSLLRRYTNAKVNTAKSLKRDATFLDHCRHENKFVGLFEPKQSYPYSKKDLDYLVKRTAIFLLDFFDNLWKNPGQLKIKKEGQKIQKTYFYFPGIETRFSFGALPLGNHSDTPPNSHKLCDRVECQDVSWVDGQVLICGHGYHETCFHILGLRCPHCFFYLSKSIEELSKSYNQRLHTNEDVNDWWKSETQNSNEECDFDKTDNLPTYLELDVELNERILGNLKFEFIKNFKTIKGKL